MPPRRHTRTILEVVGGVVAAALIVIAGAAGFALGHATSDGDHGPAGPPFAGDQFRDGDHGVWDGDHDRDGH